MTERYHDLQKRLKDSQVTFQQKVTTELLDRVYDRAEREFKVSGKYQFTDQYSFFFVGILTVEHIINSLETEGFLCEDTGKTIIVHFNPNIVPI